MLEHQKTCIDAKSSAQQSKIVPHRPAKKSQVEIWKDSKGKICALTQATMRLKILTVANPYTDGAVNAERPNRPDML